MKIFGTLTIGQEVPRCQLLITNPAAAVDTFGLIVGANPTSTDNRVVVNGRLRVMFGETDIRRGTNVLNGGLMEVNHLRIVNSGGQFEFNGGTLRSGGTTISNGRVFTVGNGIGVTTLQLLRGTHLFSDALSVANNASLTGTGSIAGLVIVQPGGTLSPGSSLGSLALNRTPALQGTTLMEISRSGTTRTNDQIQVNAAIIYGGALVVTNVGPTALTQGDRFPLYNATNYSGSFSSLLLPPLNPGLAWSNKLLMDGSIEVVLAPSQPTFASASISGTNAIFSGANGPSGQNYAVLTATNVTTPAADWQSLGTNQFGAGGQFSFTNGINRNEPQRYFRLRTP